MPAEGDGERRREQRGQHRAGIAGAGDAERQALMLRRIPARGQRQGDGEGGAGDAQHHAERQRRFEALDAEGPESGRPAITISCMMMPVSAVSDDRRARR